MYPGKLEYFEFSKIRFYTYITSICQVSIGLISTKDLQNERFMEVRI